VAWTEAYPRTKWHLDPCSRLATIHGPNFLGSGVPVQHNVAWAEAYLTTKWHLDPSGRLATIDMCRKLGAMPLFGRAGSPSNTVWPGPRPTSMPSFILIRLTVRPQYTNVTDRTDRTGQRSDSIGRTFLHRSPKNVTIILVFYHVTQNQNSLP